LLFSRKNRCKPFLEFCNKIGTFRTWLAVRLQSVVRFRADISGVTFSGRRGPHAAISIRPVSILDQRAHLAHDASRGPCAYD
jgi:hypothetical protein